MSVDIVIWPAEFAMMIIFIRHQLVEQVKKNL